MDLSEVRDSMTQSSACEELLQVQQQVRISFVESLEQEISTDSQGVLCFLMQQPLVSSQSLQEHIEHITAKEKENAKLQPLDHIYWDSHNHDGGAKLAHRREPTSLPHANNICS